MDDCTLEKLSVKPGKLSPAFNKSVLEYSVTQPSDVEKITLDLLTSDSGASYSIVGSGGDKTLPLKEGAETEIKIEVTAEDGTVKFYVIRAKRLSAKDATLNNLAVPGGEISPVFSPEVTEYDCILPCNVCEVTLVATAPDVKNEVLIGGAKPGSSTPLNVGETLVDVVVTSADGSNKKTYNVYITKKLFPRLVKLASPEEAAKYECPVSLSPLYCPVSIRGSDPKHTFSRPLIDEMTKTSKIDPLNGQPLEPDWRVVDYEIDRKISSTMVSVPLTYGGSCGPVKFCELGSHLEKCKTAPKVQEVTFKDSSTPVKHSVEMRGWEKQLQQVYGESSTEKLVSTAQGLLQKYFSSLPKPGEYSTQYEEGESPLDHLQQAACCYASAIKVKAKDPTLHLGLGLVLEERHYAEDMFGLKKQEASDDFPSLNNQAKASSRDEECAAIAKLRDVEPGAPIALQLKAIDQEYHHLVETGQSGKADHVMQLYAWKSKQASQEGVTAQKVSDEESPLGQAYLKYMDALSLDETKAVHSFHVGRLLVMQGSYSEAVPRLEVALHWNPQHQLARFYLGLSLVLQKGGAGERRKEAVGYLLESMEVLLSAVTAASMTTGTPRGVGVSSLHAENLVRPSNVYMLRGLIQLGRLLQANPDVKEAISPQDVFHTAALLSSHALPTISRGDTYRQLEWVLLEAHSNLLNLLPTSDHMTVSRRCRRLSALIEHCTIPQNTELLTLQEKTCQRLVEIQPCDSYSLYLLGTAQFAQYESTPGEAGCGALGEAKGSFLASVGLEGQPASGEPPQLLTEQAWWQKKVQAEAEKRKAAEAAKGGVKPAVTGGARGGAAARGRGGTNMPARGGQTAPSAGSRGASRGATRGATRGAAAPRGAPAAKGAPASRGGGKSVTPTSSKSSVKATTSSHKCEASKPADKSVVNSIEKPTGAAPDISPAVTAAAAPINRKSYQPRLGLGRVFRALGEAEEAQKYYQEVITMAPEVHDAYIEAADMLMKTNPLAAVDIYSQFPMSETPSFDDAYISGDIVRILIKHEKFDDPRLKTHMIAYGRVLGIGSLEKYVEILDNKLQTELLKAVYAGVNHKDVDHPDLQAFFKFKCWI